MTTAMAQGNGSENGRVFRLGLGADIALAAGKAITGYLSGSTAIVADAAHSVSDVVLSGVALLSFTAARAPRDKDHPYGHGKFETLGALGISGMLLVTAGGIAWHAADVLQGLLMSGPEIINPLVHNYHNSHNDGGHSHGLDLEHPVLALSMTLLSISVKEGLYWITKRAGEKEGSGLMKANAWHHRADAISSIVALIGVGGSIMGVPFLDPLAGLVVSGMIFKAGLETGYQSILELVDAAVAGDVLEPIRQTILQVEGIKGCHRLRGRKAGSSLYLDVHIEVDPFLSVSAAHDIGEDVRYHIHKIHNQVAEVFIHIAYISSNLHRSFIFHRSSLPDGTLSGEVVSSGQKDAEAIVSDVFSSLFDEKMTVEHITRHSLQGKVILQVQVSASPDMFIRDAMNLATEAEQKIMKTASDINQVSTQLRLSQPITQSR